MHKRRVILFLLGLVAAGAIVVLCRREREPEYGGKRLSEWVAQSAPPYTTSQGEQSADAIRHIGTNAMPYLLKWLGAKTPIWKIELYYAVDKVRGKPRGFTLYHDKKYLRTRGTLTALVFLRAEGKAAIPALSLILNDPRGPSDPIFAAMALSSMGKDALPALMAGLTNQQHVVRLVVISSLGNMRKAARPALPALRDLLQDSDLSIRGAATNSLLNIDPQAFENSDPALKRTWKLFE